MIADTSLLNIDLKILFLMSKSGNSEAQMVLYNKIGEGFIKKIASKNAFRGIEFEDLVQEGVIAFIEALPSYDEEKGCALSTYIFNSIHYHINDYINNYGRMVRYPRYLCQQILEEKKNHKKLLYHSSSNQTCSLNSLNISEELIDYIYDPFENFEEFERLEKLNVIIDEALSTLPEKEELIIRKTYGIGCKKVRIKDLAEDMGCSPPNLQYFSKKGVKAIHKRYKHILKEFL